MNSQLFIDAYGLKPSKEKMDIPPDPAQIKTVEAWIQLHCKHIKTLNRRHYSYGLKHRAEQWGRFMNDYFHTDILSSYVSNGAFIQAALNLGYIPSPIGNTFNAYFRMGVRPPNDKDEIIMESEFGKKIDFPAFEQRQAACPVGACEDI